MYYIGIDAADNNKLTYYCRNCGHVDVALSEEGVCVIDTHLKNKEQNSKHLVNKYTKLDPTLPRVNNVKCPNAACKTNASEKASPAEVIYMRYDDVNLKYIYICVTCEESWQSSN
jgi:hypothetical protein